MASTSSRRRRGASIPWVAQAAATDCGAACLSMVLAHHGRTVGLDEVRDALGVDRDGASAKAILEGARAFGLTARGVKVDVGDVPSLDPASILHWNFNHFVVFEKASQRSFTLVDPEHGRRQVSVADFRRSFTGVALLFQPGESFVPTPRPPSPVWRHARALLKDADDWPRILVLSGLVQVLLLAVPAFTAAIVDSVVPRGDAHLLHVLLAGFAALAVFQLLVTLVRGYLMLHLRTWADARMTSAFLAHLVNLPQTFFLRRAAGDLLMRLHSNLTIREILTNGALSGVLDATFVLVFLVILIAASPATAMLVVGLGALELGIIAATRRRQLALVSEGLEAQSNLESHSIEMLTGFETLKAMGAEQRAVDLWTSRFERVLDVSMARGRVETVVDALLAATRLGSPMAVLGVGAIQVLDGRQTLGTMLALSAMAAGVLGPLGSLASTVGQVQLLRSYVERLDDVFNTRPEQDSSAVRAAGTLSGQLTISGLSFRYGRHARFALKDVSVEIAAGNFVAIVGRSGSGKSTFAGLLLGLRAPSEGRVLYDGVDLATLEARSVRRQLGVVTQRPSLFAGSIRDNIALCDPSLGHDAIIAAAELAQLHAEIMAMPMGYDTMVVDGGASLAGGQRQRLALARAVAHGPRILLLDEATNALDAATEASVHAALASLHCTRIVIAHRLSTIVRADLILVMEDGRVVDSGNHAELMARGGVYGRLVAAQVC